MAATAGERTRHEIGSQPEVWRAVLGQLRDTVEPLAAEGPPSELVLTGCGSTHYLALWGARVGRQQLGRRAIAAPASELHLHPDSWLPPEGDPTLLAISRSGETTETLQAVHTFREHGGGRVVAITCEPDSRLESTADAAITLADAREHSVVQTRSFSSMLLATAWLLAGDPGTGVTDELTAQAASLLDRWNDPIVALASDESIQRFFFLGAGARFGLASEAMLKIKEMARAHAEAYHFLEARHGPLALVDRHMLVVALVGPGRPPAELTVLDDLRELGAATLVLGADRPDNDGIAVPIDAAIPDPWRDVLLLPLAQLLGHAHAVHRGLDPDAPTNLDAVVKLDD